MAAAQEGKHAQILALQKRPGGKRLRRGRGDRATRGAVVMLATAGAYCFLKLSIDAYHMLRRKCLRKLLTEVSPVLDELKIEYWADFGTLLGMVREKDIIAYDNDVDLVVLNPDWDSLYKKLRKRLPHVRVYFVIPSEDTGIRWLRISNAAGVLDLYGGYHKSGASIEISQGHGSLCDISYDHVFPLSRMKFMDSSISVPKDVMAVLTYRYGSDFMIPRYMDKGRDVIEQGKLYAKILQALAKAGLRV